MLRKMRKEVSQSVEVKKPPNIAFDGFYLIFIRRNRLTTSGNPFSIYYNNFVKMSNSGGKNFSPSKEDELMLSYEDIRDAVQRRGKEYGADKIYLFGSYARGEANEKSDVDLRIDRGNIKSGITLAGLLLDIEDDLGTPVDLVTTQSLSADFLSGIRKDEKLLYERKMFRSSGSIVRKYLQKNYTLNHERK